MKDDYIDYAEFIGVWAGWVLGSGRLGVKVTMVTNPSTKECETRSSINHNKVSMVKI